MLSGPKGSRGLAAGADPPAAAAGAPRTAQGAEAHTSPRNDTAPGGYNLLEPPDGLPESPLEPSIDSAGFRCEA
jgi:hypothetical protein